MISASIILNILSFSDYTDFNFVQKNISPIWKLSDFDWLKWVVKLCAPFETEAFNIAIQANADFYIHYNTEQTTRVETLGVQTLRVAPHPYLDQNYIVVPRAWVWKVKTWVAWWAGKSGDTKIWSRKSGHVSRLFRPMSRLSRPNFGMSRVLPPTARLKSRLSRIYVQTFKTQTFGAVMQFGSKSGSGATLGAKHV